MKYSVVIFGIKDISCKFVKYIHQNVCPVDLVVTIAEDIPQKSIISGYGSMEAIQSEMGIKVYKTKDYGLKNIEATKFFSENEFDIGITMNWSRLIPEEILNRFSVGIFGLHGSCGFLPFGKGRATLNWSLINDERRYIMHMFKLDKGVDSPNVFAWKPFEINEFDNIRSLQLKDYLVSKVLSKQLLTDYKNGKLINTHMQQNDPQMVYSGRKPKDGRINILNNTRKIYSLIRAVSHPFPGAFLYLNEERVTIWEAYPFDGVLDFSDYKLGEIIEVIDEWLIMRTVDGSLLIKSYDCKKEIEKGDILQ